jgi:hypothetical protein
MNPIDLIVYAEYSEKIPAKALGPENLKSKSNWKLLAAHWFDFSIIFCITAFIAGFYNEMFKSLMMTTTLKSAFSNENLYSIAANFLPLMIFSYFFFSYFFNDGQTFGMHFLKTRVEMKPKNFRDALRNAAKSFFLCCSCGLTYVFNQQNWDGFKSHDYLYENLLTIKESSPIHLLSEVENFEKESVIENDDWVKAA